MRVVRTLGLYAVPLLVAVLWALGFGELAYLTTGNPQAAGWTCIAILIIATLFLLWSGLTERANSIRERSIDGK